MMVKMGVIKFLVLRQLSKLFDMLSILFTF